MSTTAKFRWLIAGMIFSGAIIGAFGVPTSPMARAPFTISWWMLAAAFAGTELTVIHLQSERQAHTISLSEIPLLFGLAFASPMAVVVARLVGSGAALVLIRRQKAERLAFNLSLFLVETTSIMALAAALLGSSSPDSPRGWMAAVVAVGAGSLVTSALVSTVISMHDPAHVHNRSRTIASGVMLNVGTAVVAVIGVTIVWNQPAGVLLLLGLGTLLFFLVRVYGRLTKRHDELRAVYAFNNEIGDTGSSRDLVGSAAAALRRHLSAGFAVVGLVHGDSAVVARADADGAVQRIDQDDEGIRIYLHAVAGGDAVPVGSGGFGTKLDDGMIGGGLAIGLRGGTTERGFIVVGNRLGADDSFDVNDANLLTAMADHLASTMEARLAIEQLEEEVAEKQRIIRSKDGLIAAVSHELRTPLTGLLGFAEVLRDDTDLAEGPLGAMITSIAQEAFELSAIVEDLLTAARVDVGGLVVSSNTLDAGTLAASMVEWWQRHSGRSADLIETHVKVVGDEQRVRQILRNLLDNAARYGGPAISIEVASREGWGVIAVADNGDGIPGGQDQSVFEPYYSAHEPGTQPGSVGIGLTISRSLARLMGGDLVYRRLAGLTLFELTLPLLVDDHRSPQR